MKKRHHFVPKSYLRRFASTEPSEVIWTYDTQESELRSSNVDNTAFEKYLYSITLEDGTRTDELEDLIAGIEGRAAPILDKLIAGDDLATQERVDFASFIAIMHVRTDSFRQQYAELSMMALQIEMFELASNDEAFERHVEWYQRDRGPMSAEEIAKMRDGMINPPDFVLAVDKEWTLRALTFHDDLMRIVFQMHWSVLKAKEPRYFIASDNPVVFDVPPQYMHPFRGGGLAHEKVELTFPLSSQYCLLATWDKKQPARCDVGPEIVKFINRSQAIYARRFLFGRERDSGIRALGAKYADWKSGFRVKGFGPKKLLPVLLERGVRVKAKQAETGPFKPGVDPRADP